MADLLRIISFLDQHCKRRYKYFLDFCEELGSQEDIWRSNRWSKWEVLEPWTQSNDGIKEMMRRMIMRGQDPRLGEVELEF